jgi:DNA-binding NtrC family response regulator
VRRTILYLDDEAACLSLFSEMFGEEYDVRTAETVPDARRMLAERPADIVISDETMPGGVRGTDFLGEVAESHPSSCRVLLTGSVYWFSVIREVGGGLIHLFVPKPWGYEDMRRKLELAASYTEPGAQGRPDDRHERTGD